MFENLPAWLKCMLIIWQHSYLWGVGKVNEQLHGSLVNVPDNHFSLSALCQLSSKHRPAEDIRTQPQCFQGWPFLQKMCTCESQRRSFIPEVRAAGGQDDTMSINLLGAHHQHHITKLPVFSQQVDHFQGLPRVFVWHIRHPCWLGDPFRELIGVPQSTAAGDVHSSGVLTCTGGPSQ